jgi:subtilisin family serine protease
MRRKTRGIGHIGHIGHLGQLPAAALATAIGLSVFMSAATAADNGQGKPRANNAYIVQMAEMPVAAYQGNAKGYAATKPKKGQKIDPNAPSVVSYMAYLTAKHDAAMAGAGASKKLYTYGYVFNGFAAEMTPEQAEKLAQTSGVLSVTKDEFRSLDTASTPNFLGLTGPSGFYNTTGATGENVIIGIIDSGVWPEHPSFSDRTGSNGNGTKGGKLSYHQIPGWNGKCTPGEAFNGSDCNQKLIGARFYNAGFGGNAGIDADLPFEFNSPRDHNGHGTHTASTAGGNAGVAATGPAAIFGSINGIAPRARIAAYKACWSVPGTAGSCAGVDLLAAIDQAVSDGVDVINYSISGSLTNFRDPVEIAFLFAADAGVFVAASAGNSGPTSSTVAHPSPWITTVAAGTHNRDAQGSVTLGNGATYVGASVAGGLSSKPLIDATAAGLPGANASALALCFSAADNGGTAVLDPAKVAGKIVVCDRGVNARTGKSLAVQQAGGLGMILLNTSTNSLNGDLHVIPTVHLQASDRTAVKAYAASAGATAAINPAVIGFSAPAPLTAAFSSRGPLRAGIGDLLKPDIIAPGQDILAGVAPPNNGGRLFDLYSGTSMSSPHIAGVAALFKELYPNWSPMAIKSALMTTAGDVLDGPNTNPLVIFRQGAGHVRPSAATNPGLVFDSNFGDWLSFLCGAQPGGGCAGVTPIDRSDFNVASIAIGDMAGTQTVKRRVTNVGGNAATYTASLAGLAGMSMTMSPSPLVIAPGETREVSFAIANTGAALAAYTGGQLTLGDGSHNVRLPVVVRPVALAAPPEASGPYSVKFGYTGAFSASPRGLVAAATQSGSVAGGGTVTFQVTLPAGLTYARFSLFDSEVSQPGTDLDMTVSGPGVSGSSGSATSAEEVNFLNPPAGVYTVTVDGFSVPSGSATFKLFSWGLDSTAAGNMTVTAPATATNGSTQTIGIATSGLAPATKYLGSVVYGGVAGLPGPTIVRIDTP